MMNRIKTEPALITGLVQAVLALVVAFGLDLSADQIGTILAVTAALLALLTRATVTPVAAPQGGKHAAGTVHVIDEDREDEP